MTELEKPNNEFKLNENEEFLIVKKDNPNVFLKDIHGQITRDLDHFSKIHDQYQLMDDDKFWKIHFKPFHEHDDKNDIHEEEVTWTSSKSKRKKFNKVQSVYHYLNACNGKCTGSYKWYIEEKNSEQAYHLEQIVEHYIGKPVNPDSLKSFELRKYNPKNKLMGEAIDFDIHSYFIKYNEIFNLMQQHGLAVADVVKQLIETNKIDEYPFIFSAKFDFNKNYNPDVEDKYKMLRDIPTSRDIHLLSTIKKTGLNKEDIISFNNKGFSAIAFKTEEEALKFKEFYTDPEKLVQIKSVKNLILEANINTENIKQFYKSEQIKKVKLG